MEALTIESAPQNQSALLHQQIVFEVIAKDQSPLSYQWFKDGAAIQDAIYNELILPKARFQDSGKYSVVVSSGTESIPLEAVLSVNAPKGGDLDYSFRSGRSINGRVVSAVVGPDHKIVIIGDFTRVYGARREGIARLNNDGALDLGFNAGRVSGGGFRQIALQTDGHILVTGTFTNIAGFSRPNISRLNPDGSVDGLFVPPVLEASGSISMMQLQKDGKILIGDNNFTKVNGEAHRYLARLNSDGTLDRNFFDPAASGIGPILQFTPQTDGKVLILQEYQDPYQNKRLLRLKADGTLDSAFPPTLVANSPIVLQPDGKIISGGWFVQPGSQQFYLQRFQANGSPDLSFVSPPFERYGTTLIPSFVGLQSDGSILTAGQFFGVRRFTPDGSVDTTYSSQAAIQYQPPFGVLDDDDKLVLVGQCFSPSSTFDSAGLVLRLNSDGTADESFQRPLAGLSKGGVLMGSVSKMQATADGKILVAGDFSEVDGFRRSGFAQLNQDGTLDTGFNAAGFFGVGLSLKVQDTGNILIGYVSGLSRLNPDGAPDPEFQIPAIGSFRYSPLINEILVQKNGQILIAGRFNTVNGSPRSCIARLNQDGTLDAAFAPGGLGDIIYTDPEFPFYPYATSMALQKDGKIVIVGSFTTINGVPHKGIARLNSDGSLDVGFQPLPDATSFSSVAAQGDDKLLLTGGFSSINGIPAKSFARLNLDGGLDPSFLGKVNGNIGSLSFQGDGRMIIAGSFTAVDDLARQSLARLEPDGSLDPNFMANPSELHSAIVAMALQSDGKIIVGDPFAQVNASWAVRLLRVWGVDLPARLRVETLNARESTLVWQPAFNEKYQLESNVDLTQQNWISLGEQTSPVQVQTTNSQKQFFRIKLLP